MRPRPGQRLPHGGVLGVQPAGRGQLAVTGLQPGCGLSGHLQRVPGQRGRGAVLLPGPSRQPGPVGAQRLQHRIPGPVIRSRARRHQQRAVHQMQHRLRGASSRDGLGRLQREPRRERRDRAEYPLLAVIQQPVAPLHRGRQRPLPRRCRPVPAGQQREPVIDPVQQPRHAQRLHPRRGQLDRQRHPVQPGHQPRHHRAGLPVQREPRVGEAGSVREQRHRLRPGDIGRVVRIGQAQRPQPVPGLPSRPQRLPAGRQHPHVITGGQQRGAQLSCRADHVLAVVQHQQQLLAGQHPR